MFKKQTEATKSRNVSKNTFIDKQTLIHIYTYIYVNSTNMYITNVNLRTAKTDPIMNCSEHFTFRTYRRIY